MTQFEAISARRAFPCFDEPGFKTPWQLTLRVPRDLVAVSNTQVESEGRRRRRMKTVRFARDAAAAVVSRRVRRRSVGDRRSRRQRRGATTPMRIIVPRGRRGRRAIRRARLSASSSSYLEHYFGIPYPYDKLDHIAIPLTVGFAMENAGLITYGTPILLAQAGRRRRRASAAAPPTSARTRSRTSGSATSSRPRGGTTSGSTRRSRPGSPRRSSTLAARLRPRRRAHRGARTGDRRRHARLGAPHPPADRTRAATSSTRSTASPTRRAPRSSACSRAWIGEEPFRRGVRDYLDARRDGTATAGRLPRRARRRRASRPVAPAFDTFLNQNGVPLVEVRLQCAAEGRAARADAAAA